MLYLSPKALVPLLSYLRIVGAASPEPAPAPAGAVDVLLDRYRRFLLAERGVTPGTARG